MVYVKEGSAKLSDAAESSSVSAGQMVMISDGEVSWSEIGEGGLTLISTSAELSDVVDESAGSRVAAADEPVKDLTLKEAGVLLAGGLLCGALAAFGANTFASG